MALRAFSDVLCIPRFCDRATCGRAKACRGDSERCLALYSDRVPVEAREFVIGLLTSREFGFSFEEALRRDRPGARAYCDWCADL